MFEIREIEYFLACLDTGSFSAAAEVLYTTQSNVSRIVKSMEDRAEKTLFIRQSRGIVPTEEALAMEPFARAVMENLRRMEGEKRDEAKTLRISANPSSFFADTFVSYYMERGKKEVRYHVYSCDTREALDRVADRTDDLAFVFVMEDQLTAFRYALDRAALRTAVLAGTELCLYSAKRYGTGEIRLIQRYPEEFSPDRYTSLGEGRDLATGTAVVTNSDYIMQRLLTQGGLSNVSGAYLGRRETDKGYRGAPIGEKEVLFTAVMRKGEELSPEAEDFLAYVRESIRPEVRRTDND